MVEVEDELTHAGLAWSRIQFYISHCDIVSLLKPVAAFVKY